MKKKDAHHKRRKRAEADMKEPLRLRLVIRRHGLPEVRLVFSLPLDGDPTVSKLLEQVNDVVPIESAEWGLEDYAVELRDREGHSFECLHFYEVRAVLQQDEEVFIRPLLTQDRKKRRLGGREQISSDGKHLIDGVAFGRPQLKAPRGRPPIDIPPLKRRRLTYGGEEEDEEENEDEDEDFQPMLLTEHGEDADGEDSEDEQGVDEHEDKDDGEDEDEYMGSDDLLDELHDLQEENEQLESGPAETGPRKDSRKSQKYLKHLDRIATLRTVFPDATAIDCLDALVPSGPERQSKITLKQAYSHLANTFHATMSRKEARKHFKKLVAQRERPEARSPDLGDEGDEDAEGDDVEGDDIEGDNDGEESAAESVSSLVKHYDEHGFPAGSILDGSASAHMVEALRQSGEAVKPPVHVTFDEDGNPEAKEKGKSKSEKAKKSKPEESDASGSDSEHSESEEEEDEQEDSESESAADDSSEGDSDVGDSEGDFDVDDSESDDDGYEDSSGSSSDDSDNESGPEVSSSKPDESKSGRNHRRSESQEDAAAPESPLQAAEETSPEISDDSADSSESGSGSESDRDSGSESEGVESVSYPPTVAPPAAPPADEGRPGQGLSRTRARNARRRAAAKAKKQANNSEPPPPAPSSITLPPTVAAAARGDDDPSLLARKLALLDTLRSSAETPSPAARGSRLDVSAGRRLIFGALGMRNPKTKSDEDKIRADLMEGVRPLKNARVGEEQQEEQKGQAEEQQEEMAVDEDGQADGQEAEQEAEQEGNNPEDSPWQDKINYHAVECCQDDVELSEPPFPFVQRWDPQQQYHKQDRRGKRKQRNDSEYTQPAKKQRFAEMEGEGYEEADASLDDENVVLNYDDPDPKPAERHSQFTDLDDLPSLPADLSQLPPLARGQAQAGMVLTWKQWLLSRTTNWQPCVADMTAVVVNADDPARLRVVLARRDRDLDGRSKTFDESGNRVYDRFEGPDLGQSSDAEDEDGVEDGYRTVEFSDMMDPRILQQPLNPPEALSNGENTTGNKPASPGQSRPDPVDDNGNPESDETIIPETAPAAQLDPKGTPIPDDRRDEISRLISAAGFRNNVSPSLHKTTRFDSPSRQLQDMSNHPEPHPSTPLSIASGRRGFTGFDGSADSEPPANATVSVEYPNLVIPASPVGSGASGRQPDPDFSLDWGESFHRLDDASESAVLGDVSCAHTSEPGSPKKAQHDNNIPFAANALKSASHVGSLEAARDREWEAVLRRFDQDSEDEQDGAEQDGAEQDGAEQDGAEQDDRAQGPTHQPSTGNAGDKSASLPFRRTMPRSSQRSESDSNQAAFGHNQQSVSRGSTSPSRDPNATRVVPKEENKTETSASTSTPPLGSRPNSPPSRRTRRRTQPPGSQHPIPAGSQVVSLLSSSPASSPEPELVEVYAEDEIDQTYGDSPLPDGSGWVKKTANHAGGNNHISSSQGSARRGRGRPRGSVKKSQPPSSWAGPGSTTSSIVASPSPRRSQRNTSVRA